MTENKDAACFEFGPDHNLSLLRLSRSLLRLGLAVLIAGLLFVAYLAVSFFDPASVVTVSDTVLAVVDYALWGVMALLVICLSILVMRLAKPLRLITETAGADVSHLMRFIGDLTRLVTICFWGLSVICLLMAVSLVLLVLVF
jgi:hypothetical protein